MSTDNPKLKYTLQAADNSLILGQRLTAWCGHGPILEQDIAISNIALDLIGQSRMLYQYAASLKGTGTEDDLAFLRDAWDFYNVQLVELPNGDFAQTVLRQFFFDSFSQPFFEALAECNDEQLAAIAAKSLKEAKYHVKWSRDWVLRLGDGTIESHNRMEKALDELWRYYPEITQPNDTDTVAEAEGYGVDLSAIARVRDAFVKETLAEATLDVPEIKVPHTGGKDGKHTEHLGFILAEMQFLPRTYPGNEW